MLSGLGPEPLPSPPNLWVGCRLSLGHKMTRVVGAPATGVSPWSDAANCLLAAPFVLEAPRTTFYKGWWSSGSAGGTQNREVGIWDEAYNKITTTGAVAGNNGNEIIQSAALAATVTLPPGRYYMGMAHPDTSTNAHTRWSVATLGIALWQGLGCWRQSGITLGSLAATATPGDISNVAFPVFGLLTRTAADI